MPKRPQMQFHGGRDLINLPGFHSTGAIIAEIEDTSGWEAGKDRDGRALTQRYQTTPNYTLALSDCARTITLDLNLYDGAEQDGGFENNLHKLDTLISTLRTFRRGVALEQRRMVKRLSEIPDSD